MRVPSSMPAGMLTESVRVWLTRPAPAHFAQGSFTTSPRPWQVGQVRSIWKKPPWLARTRPAPPQVGQVVGAGAGLGAGARADVAGDAGRHLDLDGLAGEGLLERDLEIVAEVGAALAAGAALRRRRKPPKNSSKMSEKEEKPAAPAPNPPPPFSKARWPKRS